MTPVFLAVLASIANTEPAPTGAAAPGYAERVALIRADEACALFTPAERALLDALTARSRDDAARAGAETDALDRFEARIARAPQSCAQAALDAADHKAHADQLARTPDIRFPGLHQDWVSERRRQGAPLWPVHQTAAAAPARLGLSTGPDGYRLVFAARHDAAPASVRLVMRDPDRQAEPLDFTGGGLLSAPYGDPLSRWGAAAGAERSFSASTRLDAELAARLAPADGSPAHAFAFPDRAILALRALTPREGARVDLIGQRGEVLETLWFEVGMFNAALAVQALALPAPPAVDTGAAR